MKKFILTVFLAVAIGVSFGKILFDQYQKKATPVFNQDETVYVFQQGVYSTTESVKSNTTNLGYYISVKDGPYFRVYVAITKNKDYVDKVREVYLKAGNDIYVRELKTNKQNFLNLIDQYDKLLKVSQNDDEILQIEKQAISKYEEMVIRNE